VSLPLAVIFILLVLFAAGLLVRGWVFAPPPPDPERLARAAAWREGIIEAALADLEPEVRGTFRVEHGTSFGRPRFTVCFPSQAALETSERHGLQLELTAAFMEAIASQVPHGEARGPEAHPDVRFVAVGDHPS